MASQSQHPESDVIRLAFGLGAVAVTVARRTVGATLDSVHRIPVIGNPLDTAICEVTALGEEAIRASLAAADATVRSVVDVVVAAALAEIDITKIIVEHVDVDAVVDAVDLQRQVDRLDLVAIADQVIEGVDLPRIIRESTGSLSTEAVRGARAQSMQADDAVAGFVGKLLGRDRRRPPEPEPSGSEPPEPEPSGSEPPEPQPSGSEPSGPEPSGSRKLELE
ncbi:hypothetical protein ABH922_003612 [Rhodococcus sp. 27YEA15]|uniref:hypothetical protein n=1 Tax=Rhodococcus sp. 27YEA15 TaxID=3156259 RepID=UPI003C7C6928